MRLSIGKMMFLVAVCGVNFFLLGKIGADPEDYGVDRWFGELILLGGLPMLDLLALLALSRPPGLPSLDARLLGGGLALMLYLAVASIAAGPIREGTLRLLNAIAPLGTRGWPDLVGRVGLAISSNVLPQMVIGSLFERLLVSRGWQVATPTEDPRSSL